MKKPNLHELYKNKDTASFEQRAIAYVIDSILLGLAVAFLSIFTNSILAMSVLTVLYYTNFHYYLGYTPGKYFLGLRVISEKPNMTYLDFLWKREILGRIVSGMCFCIGYFVIIWHKKRKTWHDSLSKTRVISLEPVNVTPWSQVRVLAFAFVGLILLSGFSFHWLLMKSSFPLVQVFKSQKLMGLSYEGVSGNISDGFKVKNLSIRTNIADVRLRDVFILINKDKSGRKKLNFKNPTINVFEANGGIVYQKRLSTSETLMSFLLPFGSLNKPVKGQSKKSSNYNFSLEILDIRNITLHTKDRELPMHKFLILDWTVDGSGGSIQSASIDIASLYLKYTNIQKNGLDYNYNILGNLRKNSDLIEGVKRDVVFTFNQSIKNGQKLFKLDAFNKKVDILFTESNKKISINSLKLNDYFVSETPIREMNFTADAQKMQGEVTVRNRKVIFVEQNVENLFEKNHILGMTENDLQGVMLIPANILENKNWVLVFKNEKFKNPDFEDLAQFYFSKNIKARQKYKSLIAKDIKFFSKGPLANFDKSLGLKNEKVKLRSPTNKTSK